MIRFLEGRTYSANDVAENLSRIARSCRILHSAKPFVRDFNMFDIQKSYLKIVQARGYRLPNDYLDFDFWSWGMEKYEKARSEFSSDFFTKMLGQVTQK